MDRFLSWQRLFAAIFIVFITSIQFLLPRSLPAQNKPTWSAEEKPIAEQIGGLRKLPDDVRARTTTKDLALRIRELPATPNKLRLPGDWPIYLPKAISGTIRFRKSPTHLRRQFMSSLPYRKRTAIQTRFTRNWQAWCAMNMCKRASTRRNSRPRWPDFKPTTRTASAPISL
jgi:hypothetical protein